MDKKSIRIWIVSITMLMCVLFGSMSVYAGPKVLKNNQKTNLKKTVVPQPVIGGVKAIYNKNDKIVVSVFSVDYSGNVQYRVILSKPGNINSVNITNGYSPAVKASAIYKVTIPELYVEGKYKLLVYAKIANSEVEYDKTDNKVFNISKDIMLVKDGQALDLQKVTNELSGNIYIMANNVKVSNVNLKGNLIVSAGKSGNLSIINSRITSMEIKANGVKNLKLNNTKLKSVNVIKGTYNPINIEATGDTQIDYININTKVKIDINNSAVILKFDDKGNYSNLSYDSEGLVTDKAETLPTNNDNNNTPETTKSAIDVTTTPAIDASKENTTSAGVTTEAAVTTPTAVTVPEKPKTTPSEVVPPSAPQIPVTPPVQVITPPPDNTTVATKTTPPTVQFAGLLLSSSPSPVAFSGSGYDYSMDLSNMSADTMVIRLCITVSTDSTLTVNGVQFKLTAHVQKQIKVLSDFSLPDNPPEGSSLASARAFFGSSLSFSGQLSDGVNNPISVNINVKLK